MRYAALAAKVTTTVTIDHQADCAPSSSDMAIMKNSPAASRWWEEEGTRTP